MDVTLPQTTRLAVDTTTSKDTIPQVEEPISILSDLDDTLKISNTIDPLRTLFRGLFRIDAYSGMSTLYRGLLHSTGQLYLISSSPTWIQRKIQRFLRLHEFPEATIRLRDWLRETKIKNYKLEALRKIFVTTPETFLLLGDDSEHDPEVFSELRREFPNRIAAIYVRRIRGRRLPHFCTSFSLAYEVGVHEFLARRLSLKSLLTIAEENALTKRDETFIPYFAYCPRDLSVPLPHASLEAFHEKMQLRLERLYDTRGTSKPTWASIEGEV